MNIQQFYIKELRVEPRLLRDTLRCLLHTIMFNRAFGLVVPREEIIDAIDFAYVRCDDVTIHKQIEDHIEKFESVLSSRETKKGQLVISFSEKRSKKVWWKSYEEKVCWEQWILTITINDKASESDNYQAQNEVLAKRLRKRMFHILQIVNEKKNHIPPLKTNELTPFPYEITIPSATDQTWGGVDMVWNILKAPSQPLLT